MVAGAGVGIHAEPFAHDPLARGRRLAHQRLLAALFVEHALALRDQHLGTRLAGGQRLFQGIAHAGDVIGAADGANPFHTHAAHRRLDGVSGAARGVLRRRGQDVLPAGGRGVAVVDDDGEVVAAVEHRVRDAAGEPVVPEAAVPHHADGPFALRRAGRRVERRRAGRAQAVAHGRVPEIERRQDGEQVAADVGAHVVRPQLALDQLHRREDGPFRAAGAKARRPRVDAVGDRRERDHRRLERLARLDGSGLDPAVVREECARALEKLGRRILARHGQHVLAVQRGGRSRLAQDGGDVLLDEVGLPFLHHQHGALALAEAQHLAVHHRVGHVHHVEWHAAVAVDIGHAQAQEGAHQHVVAAALHHDPDLVGAFGKQFVQAPLQDEAHRGRPAFVHFLLLVQETRRRQHDPVHVALRVFQGVAHGKGRLDVVGRDELAVHMAGADAQLQHHRRMAGFRELEAALDRPHDGRQVGPRVEQPDLRFHREGVAALLHDRRTLAIVLADHDERAARHATRGQVGERVGRHIGAGGGLEGDGSAQRVVDGRRERCGSRGFAGAVLEADSVLRENVLGVGQHVHEMRDRRALVARHVGHARLQQRLRHSEDAFAAEKLAGAQPQLFHFLGKRTLSHPDPSRNPICCCSPCYDGNS